MAERAIMNALGQSFAKLMAPSTSNSVAAKSLINYQPVRHRLWTNKRPIMGWPRPHLAKKGKKYPEAHIYNWRPYLPNDGSYTIKSLPIYKMGGRDMESGRVVVRTLGGGNPKKFRWVDMKRAANEDGSVREEQVLLIRYDPLRTTRLALVADGERQRWIQATHEVNVGDIIRTFSEIPRNPVRAKVGDSHPVGALPVGTKVHLIETVPGDGAKFCLAAGSHAEIVKRSPESVTILLPNKNQIKIDRSCMVTVGQLSNPGHNLVQLWCPQRRRWLGKRPKSGQRRKKDGYCGRRNRPPKLYDIMAQKLEEKKLEEKSKELFDFIG